MKLLGITAAVLALWLGLTAECAAQSLSRYAPGLNSDLLLRVNATRAYSYSARTISVLDFGANYMVTNTTLVTGIDVGGWCLSASGDILVADNVGHVIRRVTLAGGNTVIAGSGAQGTQDGPALGGGAANANFRQPAGIVELPNGNLLIADTGNNMLRLFDRTAGTVDVIGGLPFGGGPSASSRLDGTLYVTPGAVATPGTALFAAPRQLFRLNDGRILMVEGNNVRQIDAALTDVSVFPNFPALNGPYFTVESANALLVAESGAHTISRLFLANPQNPIVLAGLPGTAGARQGPVALATLSGPRAVVSGPGGILVVADRGNSQLRRLGASLGNGPTLLTSLTNAVYEVGNSHTWKTLATGATGSGVPLFYTYARNGTQVAAGSDLTNVVVSTDLKRTDGGDWSATVYDDFDQTDIPNALLTITVTDPLFNFTTVASSSQFSGLVPAFWLHPDGNTLYFAQPSDHTIQMLQISTGVKTKIAGVQNFPGSTDGSGNQARFNAPQAVWGDGTNTLYVADTGNHILRRIQLSTRIVSTFSGAAANGSGYLDDVAGFARFETPARLQFGADGNLYVLDGVANTLGGFNGGYRYTSPFATRVRRINAFGTAATLFAPSGSGLDQFDVAPDLKLVYAELGRTDGRLMVRVLGGTQVAGNNVGDQEGTGSGASFRGSGYAPNGPFNPNPFGDGPQALHDRFTAPDNFLVVDTFNHCLRRVRATNVVTTLAGQPGVSGVANGPGTDANGNSAARFNTPIWAQFDPAGTIFVLDGNTAGQQTLRKGTRGPRLDITTQPQSQAVATGSLLNLSVGVTGTGPFVYQWARDNVNLSGETGPTLTLPAQAGTYTVIVRNTYGTAVSQPALVAVLNPPFIVQHPRSATLDPGDPVGMIVVAGGSAPLSYQWFKDGVPLPGETNDLYVILAADSSSQGLYHAVVSNPVGSRTSQTAQILVALPVTILQPPPSAPTVVNEGGNFSLAVTNLGGLPPFFFQWFKDGQAITAVSTNAALNVTNTTLADAGDYYVVITNALGSVTSSVMTVTLLPKPQITQQPVDATTYDQITTPVIFQVTATGTPPLRYQWEKNLVAIPGATNASVTVLSRMTNAGAYRVRITNLQGLIVSSNAQLTVLPSSPPAIVTEPLAQTVPAGSTVTFSVVATGIPAPGYQWVYGGAALTGATNATLTLTNVTLAETGNYFVQVFNDFGLVASTTATLRVHAPPAFLTAPQSLTVIQGATTNFTVEVSGVPAPVFTWFKDGVRLTNSSGYSAVDTANLLVLAAQGAHAGSYVVVATNVAGAITSAPVTLTVLLAPAIVTQPLAQAVPAGSTVAFSVVATGVPAPGYQWVFGGAALTGATNATLTLTNVALAEAGNYFVQVFNDFGLVASTTATLTLHAPPAFLTAPQSLTVTQGATTNFTVEVSGVPAPVFTWFKDGVRLTNSSGYSAVDTANLLVLTAQAAQAGSYVVVATNVAGAITSAPVTLTVLLAPAVTTHPTNVTLTRTNYTNALPVTLSVAATGAAPLVYQWRFNGGDLPGETNAALVLTNVTRLNNGLYQAVVANVAGTATSSNALVRVRVAQRVESPVMAPGQPFRLRFTDDNGEQPSVVDLAKLEVQAAAALLGTNTVWVTLTNALTGVNGMIEFADPASTNLMGRYYRVIER